MSGSDSIVRLRAALEGRYHIERELGEGGMATVYLADDLKHERKVALKVLKPELAAALGAERFLAEIRTTANLQHPHILPLFDSGEADGFLFYVMPHVAGESLREKLDREKQLPISEAVAITAKVAGALHVAHEQGVLHRDIKPANILIANGEPLVADFGIALAIGEERGARLTDTGMSIGTPAYMSPEQGLETGQLDRRSDVYSLGCVLYEMLIGDPPFTGSNTMAVLVRKSTEAPPSLRAVRETVPEHVEEATLRALARVPADRFATAADFVRGLATPERGPLRQPTGVWGRFSRRFTLSAAAIVGVVLGSAWLASNLRPAETRIESLAILPLEDLSGDPSLEGLISVLHDGMIEAFYSVDSITPTPRRSVLPLAEGTLSIAELARELGVDAVLEGSILQTDDDIRIRLSLIGANGEGPIWTGSYESDVERVLGLPGRFALDIVEHIGLGLTSETKARFAAEERFDPEAVAALAQGDAHFRRFDEARPLRDAIAEYRRAATLDPNFPLAWAKLSYAHTWMWWWQFDRTNDRLDLARGAAERALSLDPRLPFGNLAEGFRYESQLVFDSAMVYFDAALEVQPRNPDILLFSGMTLRGMGAWGPAVDRLTEAADADEFNVLYLEEVAGTLVDLGELEAAEDFIDRALAIRPNGLYSAAMKVDIGFRQDGDLQRAQDRMLDLADRIGAGGLAEGWNPGFVQMLAVGEPKLRSSLEAAGPTPGFLRNEASYALVMAEVYQMSGDVESATRYYGEARIFVDSVLAVGLEEREISVYAATLHGQLGLALAGLGDYEAAIREGMIAVARLPLLKSADFGVDPLVRLARIYTIAGEHELAIDRLEELMEYGLEITKTHLRMHPWWKDLRSNPRFEELARED
jgi:serine/threonine protein kinase/tetratricopeptide (TPR) repeat protein